MEKTATVDGLKTRYLEEGSGPPVIMLHGASLGSSADVFERCLGPLAGGGLRAIAYDQPGFGLTNTPADFTVSYRTAFILKFMDALKLDKAALVGHSQAGGMAARIALDHPDRVSKLLIVACGSLLPPLPDQSGKPGPAEGQEGGEQPPSLEDSRKLLESNLFNKSLATPEALRKRHEMSVGKNFENFVARNKTREPQKDAVPLWQRLKDLSMPLLMLYGMQDRGSAAKRAALFKEKEPNLKIELVDNAAHLLMWDAAEKFNQRAVQFLSA
jgi:pimeloyl-ACP methyl ester carboxylesterase